MMPIFTSCMPEIIGDDLTAFIKNAKNKGVVPVDFPTPYANTPSFNGSHIHGYDAMLLAILQTLTEGKQVEGRCTGKLNLIAGFDANTGNYREYKRILEAFGIPYTFLADISETFDSPLDGHYKIYPGGTKLDDAADRSTARRRSRWLHDDQDLHLVEGGLAGSTRPCRCPWNRQDRRLPA
jgi:nitrogenase molybdenum-iron protein beta chain